MWVRLVVLGWMQFVIGCGSRWQRLFGWLHWTGNLTLELRISITFFFSLLPLPFRIKIQVYIDDNIGGICVVVPLKLVYVFEVFFRYKLPRSFCHSFFCCHIIIHGDCILVITALLLLLVSFEMTPRHHWSYTNITVLSEGLVCRWYVCWLHCGSSCSLVWPVDGRMMCCGIISSC